MSNFNFLIDGSLVLFYLILTILIGVFLRKYIKGVDDFLLAGRNVDLYLGIASLSATEFGIATCMANSELGYKYGFAGITPGIALAFAMFVVGWTGFCIKPLRDQSITTLPEFFENKFGSKVRWASGLVIVIGGLLNMGIFLRQAGEFLSVILGVDFINIELLMTLILCAVAIYTIFGGMVSVLITDYIQFVVMSIGLITATLIVLFTFGWTELTQTLTELRGEPAFNPFINDSYSIERIVLDVFVAFAVILTWQTIITRVLVAKDTQTGKKVYMATAPFFLVRFAIPVILGIGALHYFGADQFQSNAVVALPNLLAVMLPVGLIGLLVASMLAADMSTNSSYLIAWSSVIYNDLLKPVHRGLWGPEKGVFWNRLFIVFIGLFLLGYGLWYPMKDDLWVYLQVTGTIYLASMSVILIAACYWKAANNWGAFAAIATGSVIPITYLVLQQIETTAISMHNIGPYYIGISTYILTGLAMILGSLLKPNKKKS